MRLWIESLRFPGRGVLGSLRFRLGAAVLVSTGIILVLLLGYLMAIFEGASREASRSELLGMARSFSDDFGARDLTDPTTLTRRIERLEEINPNLSGVSVYRLDERGRGVRLASTEKRAVLTPPDAKGEPADGRGTPGPPPVTNAEVRAIRTGRPEFMETQVGDEHLAVLGFPVPAPATVPSRFSGSTTTSTRATWRSPARNGSSCSSSSPAWPSWLF
jgi:hypothetical protein